MNSNNPDTKNLRRAITGAAVGQISNDELLEIFQQAIDNGDVLEQDNRFFVATLILPLVEMGELKRSPHLDEYEERIKGTELGRLAEPYMKKDPPDTELEDLAQADQTLASVRRRLQGTTYAKLIEKRMEKMSVIVDGICDGLYGLDKTEGDVTQCVLDEFKLKGYDADFWQTDSGDVFDQVCSRFAERMAAVDRSPDHLSKLRTFQTLTFNFALLAREQPALRRLAGITCES
jgi:hypothetical protein